MNNNKISHVTPTMTDVTLIVAAEAIEEVTMKQTLTRMDCGNLEPETADVAAAIQSSSSTATLQSLTMSTRMRFRRRFFRPWEQSIRNNQETLVTTTGMTTGPTKCAKENGQQLHGSFCGGVDQDTLSALTGLVNNIQKENIDDFVEEDELWYTKTTTRNIDHAMRSLYVLDEEPLHEQRAHDNGGAMNLADNTAAFAHLSPSFVPMWQEDWLLDGPSLLVRHQQDYNRNGEPHQHENNHCDRNDNDNNNSNSNVPSPATTAQWSWLDHAQQSQELVQQLYPERPDSAFYETLWYWEKHATAIQEELLQYLQQQTHDDDKSGEPVAVNINSSNPDDKDDDDEFGEFQSAVTTMTIEPPWQQSNSNIQSWNEAEEEKRDQEHDIEAQEEDTTELDEPVETRRLVVHGSTHISSAAAFLVSPALDMDGGGPDNGSHNDPSKALPEANADEEDSVGEFASAQDLVVMMVPELNDSATNHVDSNLEGAWGNRDNGSAFVFAYGNDGVPFSESSCDPHLAAAGMWKRSNGVGVSTFSHAAAESFYSWSTEKLLQQAEAVLQRHGVMVDDDDTDHVTNPQPDHSTSPMRSGLGAMVVTEETQMGSVPVTASNPSRQQDAATLTPELIRQADHVLLLQRRKQHDGVFTFDMTHPTNNNDNSKSPCDDSRPDSDWQAAKETKEGEVDDNDDHSKEHAYTVKAESVVDKEKGESARDCCRPHQSPLAQSDDRAKNQQAGQQQSNSEILAGQNMSESSDDDDATEDASLGQQFDLPDYYFTRPDMDDTAHLLQSLPWHYLHLQPDPTVAGGNKAELADSPDEDDWMLWEESMTTKLCHLDAALEQVQKRLLLKPQRDRQKIRNNRSSPCRRSNPQCLLSLKQVNDMIHDWEQSLRLAFMYWERSKGSLDAAWEGSSSSTNVDGQSDSDQHLGSGIQGLTTLLNGWDQLEQCKALDSVLLQAEQVLLKEQELAKRIDSFGVEDAFAMDQYKSIIKDIHFLQRSVRQGSLARLECLQDLQKRLSCMDERFGKRLLVIAESIVARCCRGKLQPDEWVEYERLVQAMLELEYGVASSPTDAKVWCENILASLRYEADRALAQALLEPWAPEDSSYEKELSQMSLELDLSWGDGAKLRTLTHNLVTIRFNFEAGQNGYLYRVYGQLCNLLFDVLKCHFSLVQWHAAAGEKCMFGSNHRTSMECILSELKESRQRIWGHCESVLERCLEEYINFSPDRQLFEMKDGGELDDSKWAQDLESMHGVIQLTRDFLAKKVHFSEHDEDSEVALSNHPLNEHLATIAQKHLRITHRASMNTMGRKLAGESWLLRSFTVPAAGTADIVYNTFSRALLDRFLFSGMCVSESRDSHDLKGQNGDKGEASIFSLMVNSGNPFRPMNTDRISFDWKLPAFADVGIESCTRLDYLHQVLQEILSQTNDRERKLAPDCVVHDLAGWFGRLLVTIVKLPLIGDAVARVFEHLCDLYFTTVFRICTGNSLNERLVLGFDHPGPFKHHSVDRSNVKSANGTFPSSPLFKSLRRNSRRPSVRPQPILPGQLDAEICAPLMKDHSSAVNLRRFFQRAHDNLQNIVNLERVASWIKDPSTDLSLEEYSCQAAMVLEKRGAAIWSCHAVAGLVDVAFRISKCISSRLTACCGLSLGELQSYRSEMLDILPSLVSTAKLVSCTRALPSIQIVKDVIDVGPAWDECQLNEHPNDYVDSLCDKCCLILGYLTTSAKLPTAIVKDTWGCVVEASFLSLLEGFARVPCNATEGRALMALDLATFHAAISPSSILERLEQRDLIAQVPNARPERGMQYVANFVKSFYYPPEDALKWIQDNYRNYQLNHMVALVSVASDQGNENATADMVEVVRNLYRVESSDNRVRRRVGSNALPLPEGVQQKLS